VVIALSDEPMEKVEPYMEQMDAPNVWVGTGSSAGGAYGVRGIPKSFLIGPDGKVAWHGHPSEVNKSLLKGVLKGAKKPSGGMLGVKTDFKVDPKVAKAQTLAADGQLSAALKAIAAIEADAAATEQQKSDAKAVREAIERHAESLNASGERFVKAKDVGKGLQVLDALANELAGTDAGTKASKRAEEIRGDKALMGELEAAKALDKLREQLKSLAASKARPKYEEFAKKYAGTKAADRAKMLARPQKG
jgi:hypothetical protein